MSSGAGSAPTAGVRQPSAANAAAGLAVKRLWGREIRVSDSQGACRQVRARLPTAGVQREPSAANAAAGLAVKRLWGSTERQYLPGVVARR